MVAHAHACPDDAALLATATALFTTAAHLAAFPAAPYALLGALAGEGSDRGARDRVALLAQHGLAATVALPRPLGRQRHLAYRTGRGVAALGAATGQDPTLLAAARGQRRPRPHRGAGPGRADRRPRPGAHHARAGGPGPTPGPHLNRRPAGGRRPPRAPRARRGLLARDRPRRPDRDAGCHRGAAGRPARLLAGALAAGPAGPASAPRRRPDTARRPRADPVPPAPGRTHQRRLRRRLKQTKRRNAD